MALIDLTMDFIGERFASEINREEVFLNSGLTSYTGVVYTVTHDSMSGTYIDFPGHIAETDNGLYADNAPLSLFFAVPAQVIRLHRKSGSGAVSAADLEQALNGRLVPETLVINALGNLDPLDIEFRSVFLDDSAVQWIIDRGCKLLISDIYESMALHGVFLRLFRAGITTVCKPVNLFELPEDLVRISVLFARMPGVTQLPCRIVAEF